MDLRKIKELIKLIDNSQVTEIELREDGTVRLCRNPATPPAAAPPVTLAAAPAAAPTPKPEPKPDPFEHTITSPMVGTLYQAPGPDQPPFVQVGSQVKVGDTVCIIEAMKMLNEIVADKAGTITAILTENGHPVEFEQPLFMIK